MMKKEPYLSQKKPKRTLSENKMVHAGKIMLQSTTTHQKLPCDTKKNIKNGYQKIYDCKKKQYFTIAKIITQLNANCCMYTKYENRFTSRLRSLLNFG